MKLKMNTMDVVPVDMSDMEEGPTGGGDVETQHWSKYDAAGLLSAGVV